MPTANPPAQPVTVGFILATLKTYVENKMTVSPSKWVDAAQKLNVLYGDECDRLYDLEQIVAKEEVRLLDTQEGEKLNVSEAKLRIKSFDMYKAMRQQQSRVKQIEEFIRIAKLQARMKDTEYGNSNF